MNFNLLFQEIIKGNEEFNEALSIARVNSKGNVWIIGGYVFRNLTSRIYGTPEPKCDIDFVVEEFGDKPIGFGWDINKNRYGNYKFRKNGVVVDVVPLDNIHSIQRRNVRPSIENYLTGVPLTIQSIAYDVFAGNIIGAVGIGALQNGIVQVYNREEAEYYASKKEKPLEVLMQEFAKSLGFSAV